MIWRIDSCSCRVIVDASAESWVIEEWYGSRVCLGKETQEIYCSVDNKDLWEVMEEV